MTQQCKASIIMSSYSVELIILILTLLDKYQNDIIISKIIILSYLGYKYKYAFYVSFFLQEGNFTIKSIINRY